MIFEELLLQTEADTNYCIQHGMVLYNVKILIFSFLLERITAHSEG